MDPLEDPVPPPHGPCGSFTMFKRQVQPMKIGALQTAYLPWLGFFDQIYQCDLFIIYDDLQYTRKDWRNRNRIKTPRGAMWLTVPVKAHDAHKRRICQVEISGQGRWSMRHWLALKMNYSRAPYFALYADFFHDLYRHPWTRLVPLNREIIDWCLDRLRISTTVLYSSEEGLEQDYLSLCGDRPDPAERVIYLCRRFEAQQFLEGPSGKAYLREKVLADAGVTLEYHHYPHPRYRQRFGDFIPYLSVVDLLFNHGDESLNILTGRAPCKGA